MGDRVNHKRKMYPDADCGPGYEDTEGAHSSPTPAGRSASNVSSRATVSAMVRNSVAQTAQYTPPYVEKS